MEQLCVCEMLKTGDSSIEVSNLCQTCVKLCVWLEGRFKTVSTAGYVKLPRCVFSYGLCFICGLYKMSFFLSVVYGISHRLRAIIHDQWSTQLNSTQLKSTNLYYPINRELSQLVIVKIWQKNKYFISLISHIKRNSLSLQRQGSNSVPLGLL
jgi:hypothetical protein